ncbi:hypothetical protein SDC9_142743 [bioreactor metagenome]|uniref:Uncharacterized protein n=1 Tax=bioreactor metagenome TaxID=1076179 RepID=A0A645E2G9_9ZZZZ
MTNRNIVSGSAATLRYNHFTIAHRQYRRPLRHRKVDTFVRRYASSHRIQATRVKVRGNTELFRRRETHEAFRQPGTVTVIELTVCCTDGIIVFAFRT